MNVVYKWLLNYDDMSVEVHPIYKDDLALDYQQEQGKMFYRGKLSGKISFVGSDADHIINAPFYTEFNVVILKRTVVDTTWSNYYQCRFYKTDCTINEDDKKVEVQPLVVDLYNDILNGLEKEYNLLEMPLAIQPIQAAKRPMFQVYVDGDNIVSCVSGSTSFETDRINDDVSPLDCYFTVFNDKWQISFEGSGIPALNTPFIGVFSGLGQQAPYDRFYNKDNIYYLQYFEETYSDPDFNYYVNGLRIMRNSDDVKVWEMEQVVVGAFADLPSTMTFLPVNEQEPTLTATRREISIYGRLVCDLERIEMSPDTFWDTYPIGNNDIVANNRNYRYCLGFGAMRVEQSNRYSETPTIWGRTDMGNYFLPPNDYEAFVPIGRSLWGNISLWLSVDMVPYYDTKASKQYTIKDTYPLASVINALLSKVAPNVSFNENAASSIFFYDDTVLTGVASVLNGTRPFLSQKSNILFGEYQEPAQKAPITLKTVFDMLQKVYGCYWYIKANNTLAIEHVSWFKNGGGYTGNPVIGYDLTELVNLPNNKKWAFATSEYQFDKVDMPARYQYEWMDESSDMFKGKPINVLSKFVTENKVEDINIANVSSDIDLMLLAPEKFSKDGFALLQASKQGNDYILPLHTYYEGVHQYRLQNYMVAMVFLQPNFLTYDMPSWSITIDDTATTAAGIKRNKKQTITFPIGINDPDINHLVKTYIGNGQFDKLSINLSSRMAKATLKYNTYDE